VQVYGAGPAVRYDYRGALDELHTAAQRFIATVLGQGHRISQPIRIVFLAERPRAARVAARELSR
jgi:DNA-binding winged helix-turn-helix (wHTH) protein